MKRIKILTILLMTITASTSCNRGSSGAAYGGQDISPQFTVTRNPGDALATVEISSPENWRIYGGPCPDGIDLRQPLAEGDGPSRISIAVPDSVRYYFRVETPDGFATIAEKRLPLLGAFNFRDLGGIRTTDGRFVRWGLLFRSDELNDLKPSDLLYLESLPLRTVVDFRSLDEMGRNPDILPSTVKETFALNVSPGNLSQLANSFEELNSEVIDGLMEQLNVAMVSDGAVVGQYRRYFEIISDRDNLPLVFHCTAGKDRTGMAAALTLLALGVDMDTVMSDYMASNQYLDGKFGEYKRRYPQLADLFGVSPEFIGAGLDQIVDLYGSVSNYLHEVLNVDTELLREIYLY